MSAPVRRKSSVFAYRGKWRIQFLDHQGKSRTKTAASQKEAFRILAEIEGVGHRGFYQPLPSQVPTFSQWSSFWLNWKKAELSPITWIGYSATIKNYLNPTFGSQRLDTITPHQIQMLYSHLQASRGLSAGTIRKMHALLSGIFSLAQKQALIFKNPLDTVMAPRLERKPTQVFTPEELETILKTVCLQSPTQILRWRLALVYGLRQGECLGLKFQDYDQKTKTIKIRRTVNSLPGQGVVELPVKSKNSLRKIPLDFQTATILEKLQSQTNRQFLFEAKSGCALEATVDQRAWRKLLETAQVQHLPLHAARHSVATKLISENHSPRAVQMLLGHSSPAYTLATYVHPSIEEIRALFQKPEAVSANQKELIF